MNDIPVLHKKYYLLSKLGEGATSHVYIGSPLHNTHHYVAIKIITNKHIRKNAFEQEVEILSNIKSANVIQLIEFGFGPIERRLQISDDKKYLILEYASKGNLFNYIYYPERSFGEEYGKFIFHQLLQGVQAIHNNGFVHRDLKIENIMFDCNYNIKIADFGFATHKDGKQGLGKLTSRLGTLKYCAPEILKNRPYVGTLVDVYSLGVCLFVLVFGRFPFGKAAKDDVGYKLIMEKKFDVFWDNVKKKNSITNSDITVSDELMNLFNQMVYFDSSYRPTVDNVIEHPFFKTAMPTYEQVCCELSEREKIINYKQQLIYTKHQEESEKEITQQQQQSNEVTYRGNNVDEEKEEDVFGKDSAVKVYTSDSSAVTQGGSGVYFVKVEGIVPWTFMNRLVKEMKKEEMKCVIGDCNKMTFIVKMMLQEGSEGDCEEEENEDDDDDEGMMKVEVEELVVKVSLKKENKEDSQRYLVVIRKLQGDYEMFYTLYQRIVDVIKHI